MSFNSKVKDFLNP